MNKKINLCIIAGTHGDESHFGLRVQEVVEREMPGAAYMLVGNPRASEANKRFINSDLNRSFGGNGNGYEAERAEELKDLFKNEGFTHLVDIHTAPTTHSIVPIIPAQCAGKESNLVVKSNPAVSHIVELGDNDPPDSLTASFGVGGIALECPRYADEQFALKVAEGIIRLLNDQIGPGLKRSVYKALGFIPSSSILESNLDDFKSLPNDDALAFVAAPTIYEKLGYGHKGMRVKYVGEKII